MLLFLFLALPICRFFACVLATTLLAHALVWLDFVCIIDHVRGVVCQYGLLPSFVTSIRSCFAAWLCGLFSFVGSHGHRP